MAEIKLENVTKSYNGNTVLNNFSLSVQDGECFSILGPSPCGKTTVLRCIAGFEKVDQGEIFIGNTLVTSKKERVFIPPERRNIGIVFQDYAVWPHMTAYENVLYPLKKRKTAKADAKRFTVDALKQVQLGDYMHRLPNQLSGGQQQRVALARSLVSSDQVILLDEPLCNLDANLREEMRFEIKELKKKIGTTIILVTHDQDDALAVSDRVAVLDKEANIRQIGTPEDLYRNPVDSYVFKFLGLSNFLPLVASDNRVVIKNSDSMIFPHPISPDMTKSDFFAAFRPKDVELTHKADLKGIIKRVIFLGSIYEYRVKLGDTEIRVQQDSNNTTQNQMFKENDICGVNLRNVRYYEEAERE